MPELKPLKRLVGKAHDLRGAHREPKARPGARPAPMRVWIRHRIPALNVLVRGLLHAAHHDEAPERNPFK